MAQAKRAARTMIFISQKLLGPDEHWIPDGIRIYIVVTILSTEGRYILSLWFTWRFRTLSTFTFDWCVFLLLEQIAERCLNYYIQ